MKSSSLPAKSTVSPCLTVESIPEEIRFLQAVFEARPSPKSGDARGPLSQAEVELGNVTLRLGRVHHDGVPVTGMLYVWVDDVDGIFGRAVEQGATVISDPTDQPSGVREAGFRDPQGQIWWLGRRGTRLSNEEVARRLAAQRKSRS
jgi:PhnB protein